MGPKLHPVGLHYFQTVRSMRPIQHKLLLESSSSTFGHSQELVGQSRDHLFCIGDGGLVLVEAKPGDCQGSRRDGWRIAGSGMDWPLRQYFTVQVMFYTTNAYGPYLLTEPVMQGGSMHQPGGFGWLHCAETTSMISGSMPAQARP